jgi:hypothetical protein
VDSIPISFPFPFLFPIWPPGIGIDGNVSADVEMRVADTDTESDADDNFECKSARRALALRWPLPL